VAQSADAAASHPLKLPSAIGLNAPMPDLTRRPDPHRADCWLVHYGDVRFGTIAHCLGPNAESQWPWLCGFYPGSNPGELQRDDVRFVAGHSLSVARNENDEFRIEEDQEFTFINSGNRQAVVTEIYGTLVLVTGSKAQCANRFAKNIILNANKIVLKPGEIQLLRAKVVKEYPWEKGKDGLYFRETKTSQTYIVCIEFYVTTPDSSSVRLVQPLYELAPGKSPVELFNKDEPIKVVNRTRLGFD
jgi:hypothetical protein